MHVGWSPTTPLSSPSSLLWMPTPLFPHCPALKPGTPARPPTNRRLERCAGDRRNLQHANLVRFYGVVKLEANSYWLVMELVNEGNLERHWRTAHAEGTPLPWTTVVHLCHGAAQARRARQHRERRGCRGCRGSLCGLVQ